MMTDTIITTTKTTTTSHFLPGDRSGGRAESEPGLERGGRRDTGVAASSSGFGFDETFNGKLQKIEVMMKAFSYIEQKITLVIKY